MTVLTSNTARDIPADVIAASWEAYRSMGITPTVLPPCDERIWPIVRAILADRAARETFSTFDRCNNV
jgi:hypothetical protein